MGARWSFGKSGFFIFLRPLGRTKANQLRRFAGLRSALSRILLVGLPAAFVRQKVISSARLYESGYSFWMMSKILPERKMKIWILWCLFLTGCASSSVYLPDQTFILPESNGGWWKGEAGLGVRSLTEVAVFNDLNASPPDSSGANIKEDGPVSYNTLPVGIFGSLGLGKYLDLIYANGFGLKVVLFGDDSPWRISVFGTQDAYGFGPQFGTEKFSADVKKNYVGTGVGYRCSDEILLYLDWVREWFTIDSKVKDSSTEWTYSEKGTHERISPGISWKLEQRWNAIFETSATSTTFPRANSNHALSAGLAFYYHW